MFSVYLFQFQGAIFVNVAFAGEQELIPLMFTINTLRYFIEEVQETLPYLN